MAKVVSLINQKGGVGKTASTNAITVCLKHRGYRTLCVDFDPQGYLSFSTNADTRSHCTIYDVLKHSARIQDAIQSTNVADVIPADALLGNVEREFTGPGAESMLKSCLKPILSAYDYILIDSPPELGLLSANAVIASNVVLIPGLADGYSLQGFIQVHETIERIRKSFNPELVIGGLFLTRYYPREELSRTAQETASMLAKCLKIPLLDTVIRHSNVISRAMTTLQVDVVDYAPDNNAVADYEALVTELFERRIF